MHHIRHGRVFVQSGHKSSIPSRQDRPVRLRPPWPQMASRDVF